MSDERRRYFRINETVGVSYSLVDAADKSSQSLSADDIFELVSEQDQQIEQLLIEVSKESPKVAALVTAFNQKLERVVGQLVMNNQLLNQIAVRVREVNISACGIAFINDHDLPPGTRLKLELQLFPSEERIATHGVLVGSEKSPSKKEYYWRIDFYGMRKTDQEALIQHIVKRQSAQLRQRTDKK